MSRGSCPRLVRDGCPVSERKGGCFSDTDHNLAQKFRYLGLLVSKYIDTPENKVRRCRWDHENKDDDAVPIPSQAHMLETVMEAYRDGFINLNKRQLARLEMMETEIELSSLPLEGAA